MEYYDIILNKKSNMDKNDEGKVKNKKKVKDINELLKKKKKKLVLTVNDKAKLILNPKYDDGEKAKLFKSKNAILKPDKVKPTNVIEIDKNDEEHVINPKDLQDVYKGLNENQIKILNETKEHYDKLAYKAGKYHRSDEMASKLYDHKIDEIELKIATYDKEISTGSDKDGNKLSNQQIGSRKKYIKDYIEKLKKLKDKKNKVLYEEDEDMQIEIKH
jgi:hypothetical protein